MAQEEELPQGLAQNPAKKTHKKKTAGSLTDLAGVKAAQKLKEEAQGIQQLTKREGQIMNVLWNSQEPLSAHDILVAQPDLSRNTIQIVLKKLQSLGFIEVAGFSYNKNALTRTFKPVIAQSEYISRTLARKTSFELAKLFIEKSSRQELEILMDLIERKRRAFEECQAV